MRTIQCQINIMNNKEYQDIISLEIPTVFESNGYEYSEDLSDILKDYSEELFKKYFGNYIWLVVDVTIEFVTTHNYFDGNEEEIESHCKVVFGTIDGKPLKNEVREIEIEL